MKWINLELFFSWTFLKLTESLGYEHGTGIYVSEVYADSNAEREGLKVSNFWMKIGRLNNLINFSLRKFLEFSSRT